MHFISSAALFGMLAIAIPIIVHLQKRKKAKVVTWAAMQFLSHSLARRRRGITIEHFLLLLCRCLLIAAFVLALARPFVESFDDLRMPVVFVAITLAIVGFIYAAIGSLVTINRLVSSAIACIFLIIAVLVGKMGDEPRFVAVDQPRDVAIVVDCSNSMQLSVDGQTNFERAIVEAKVLVDDLPGGSTVSLFAAGGITKLVNTQGDANLRRAADQVQAIEFIGGQSHIQNAVAQAKQSLSFGKNPQKQIITFTDTQLCNWDSETTLEPTNSQLKLVDDASRDFHEESDQDANEADNVDKNSINQIVRAFELPGTFENTAITDIQIQAKTVSIFRPTNIEVAVFNNGTTPVSNRQIELKIDNRLVKSKRLATLSPGSRQTLVFEYQFKSSGLNVVSARLPDPDALDLDNELHFIVDVIATRKVLVVNGDFVNQPHDRSATFLQLALDPGSVQHNRENDKGIFHVDVINASDLHAKIESLNDYHAVALCDVSQLPATLANSVAQYVNHGGGLIVFAGRNIQPSFYNQWTHLNDDVPFFPFLIESQAKDRKDDPIGIDFDVVNDQSLKQMLETGEHDLTEFKAFSYWQLKNRNSHEPDNFAALHCLRFANGDPYVTQFAVNKGRVIFMTSTLHPSESNLIQRLSFPVLMHTWTHQLADVRGLDFNHAPALNTRLKVPPSLKQSLPESLLLAKPNGVVSDVQLQNDDGELVCDLGETATPGLYSVKNKVSGLAGNQRSTVLPFTVGVGENEYDLTPIAKHKFDELANKFSLQWVNDSKRILETAGSVPTGFEIWKPLLFACLFFIVVEAIIQRWIQFRRTASTNSSSQTESVPPPLNHPAEQLGDRMLEDVA